MKTNYLIALAAGGSLLAGTASAQEKKIKRSDLPPAVEKTVAAQSTGATIRGFSTEKENGQTLYEVEMTVNGHSKDISIAVGGNGDVLTMAVDGHFHFVEGLAVFFFCRESANGCSSALGRDSFFDRGRKVGALDFLFLGGGGSCEQ